MHGTTDDRQQHTKQIITVDGLNLSFCCWCCCCFCFYNFHGPKWIVVQSIETRRADGLAARRLWSDDNNDCDDGGCLLCARFSAFVCICLRFGACARVFVIRCWVWRKDKYSTGSSEAVHGAYMFNCFCPRNSLQQASSSVVVRCSVHAVPLVCSRIYYHKYKHNPNTPFVAHIHSWNMVDTLHTST